MKISALLVVSLVSAVGGSLFVSGLLPAFLPGATIHGHGNVPQAEAAVLPLHVIERFTERTMAGDAETGSSMKIDEEFVDPENHCEFCTRVEYVPGSRGVAGFAYGSDSPVDLTGAEKVRFWVMGEDGGEKVKFKIGGKERDDDRLSNAISTIFDNEGFARSSDQVTLRDDWTKFEIDLADTDLREITHPFGLEIAKGSGDKSQIVYIKGIIVDDESVDPETELATTAEAVEENEDEEDMSVEISSNSTTGDSSSSFRLRATVTGGEGPYSYLWDFDDGDESSGRTVTHSFDEPGTFNVTVVVTDDTDRQATGSIEIEITEESDEAEDEEIEDEVQEDVGVPDEGDSARNATGSQRSQARGNSTGEE